jgi:chaperone required for assembly of F1-ATPase
LLLAEGVIHVEQPREAIAAIGVHLNQRAEPLKLAALHVMTSLTGSAVLALAVDFRELDAETAWQAAHVDEDFQAEHWGQDAEALARRASRKRDMIAAAKLIEAIGA